MNIAITKYTFLNQINNNNNKIKIGSLFNQFNFVSPSQHQQIQAD